MGVVVYDGFVQDGHPFVLVFLFEPRVVFAEPLGVFFVA